MYQYKQCILPVLDWKWCHFGSTLCITVLTHVASLLVTQHYPSVVLVCEYIQCLLQLVSLYVFFIYFFCVGFLEGCIFGIAKSLIHKTSYLITTIYIHEPINDSDIFLNTHTDSFACSIPCIICFHRAWAEKTLTPSQWKLRIRFFLPLLIISCYFMALESQFLCTENGNWNLTSSYNRT